MILTIFITLIALSVVVILLGYVTDDEPYLTIGLFFLFLLSTVIITGNLTYQTGEDKNIVFVYDNSTLAAQMETTSYTYNAWDDNTSQKVGWGLGIASGFGFALSLYTMKKRRMNANE